MTFATSHPYNDLVARITRVVPAILTSEPEALHRMIRQAENFASYVQFDIMDGHFVPTYSITDKTLATVTIKFKWEAHLMVEHPANYLVNFKKLGASKVVFHYESSPSPEEIISLARQLSIEVGLAINPTTPISAILPLVETVDSLLFMTVQPGFYGSKFQSQVIDKIAEFRRLHPMFEIGVDGGINETNVALIANSGVNDICVGSAIFLQPSPSESYRRLLTLTEEASQGQTKS
ncbi:MAG: ribulose-phosphate 3-epimerase [Dehalococcoidales bacterium]|nr:ribulose-phosphate 3-epimerase [Dehalococcoidales bacterium]